MAKRQLGRDSAAEALCVKCGLCCNGTLFSYVLLSAKDKLAARPIDLITLEDGQWGMKQSCHFYRHQLCSIYRKGQPKSCINFRCQLLRRYSRAEISLKDALDIVQETLTRVADITAKLSTLPDAPKRNLAEQFKSWLAAIGGCYSGRSPEDQAILAEYSNLQSHLKQTFGIQQAEEQPATEPET